MQGSPPAGEPAPPDPPTGGDALRAVLEELVEHLPLALFLVSSSGRVVHANGAARRALSLPSGPRLDPQGRLRLLSSPERRWLDSTLAAIRAEPRGQIHAWDPKRDAAGSMLLLVLEAKADSRGAVAAVILPPRGFDAAAPIERSSRDDFTPAERRIARYLVQGHGPEQVADALGVSVNTVRTHLQHLFQKTDTHRQSALVARLLGDLAVGAARSHPDE